MCITLQNFLYNVLQGFYSVFFSYLPSNLNVSHKLPGVTISY